MNTYEKVDVDTVVINGETYKKTGRKTLYDSIFSDCPMGRQDVCAAVEKWLNDNRFISYSDCNEKWNECIDCLQGKIK